MAQSKHFPPPPLAPEPDALWAATPPAIFPPIMGLLGVGLAWRVLAARVSGPLQEPLLGLAEGLLGAAVLLWVFAALAWLSKPLRRPAVIAEELRVLPGRAGLAAANLSMMLSAAALVPYAPALAGAMVALAIGLHLALGAAVFWGYLFGPEDRRSVTPVFHLVFVGFILAPLSLIPLGFAGLSSVIFHMVMPVAALIWGVSLWQLVKRSPPAPLRPLLAIHIAPAALFATVGAMLGHGQVSGAFMGLGLGLLLGLVLRWRWVAESGFSPLWGAFTFPVAALAGALLRYPGAGGQVLGVIVLLVATAVTAGVLRRVMKMWATGDLARKTNAARI
jgi:tellurite resistance protein